MANIHIWSTLPVPSRTLPSTCAQTAKIRENDGQRGMTFQGNSVCTTHSHAILGKFRPDCTNSAESQGVAVASMFHEQSTAQPPLSHKNH